MKAKLFFTTVILFGINFLNAQQWTTMAPMPTARNSAGVAVIGNTIYVIGGSSATTNLNTVEAYDTTTNTWSTKAPMTVIRGELVVAAVNGKIYAIGGYNNTTAVNTVEEYNPTTNTWTTKASMPTARSVMSGAVLNNQIYVVGGWPGNIATLEVYDPAINTWTTKAPCTQARQEINGAVGFNGKLYFMGGKNNVMTSYYQTNDMYDPTTNSWTTQANLPISRWAGAALSYMGEIHYLGGSTGGTYQNSSIPNFNTHYVYNATANTWSTGLAMLSTRSRHVAAVVGTSLYVIGGIDSAGTNVALNERYDNASTASCPTLNGTLTNGLLAYYPFCGNANDASGNSNNGTVSGATLTTDRFGNANSAYSFNGSSDFISGAANTTFTQKPMTFSFWFYKTAAGNLCNYGGNNIEPGMSIFSVGTYGSSIDVKLSSDGTKIGLGRSIPAGVASENELVLSSNYALNSWNHVVVTYDNSTVKVYINGINLGSLNYATSTTIANTTWYIGKSNPSIWACVQYMKGKIDDLTIYNRILNDSEIATLYSSNLCYESVTVTDTLVINTGILSYNPITYNNTVTIYPNPANDHITIDCGTLANVVGYSIKITNTVGQEVFNQPMTTQQYYVPLNTWTGQGLYFVSIIDAQGHTIDVRKIILQ